MINQAVADRLAAEGFDVRQAYDGPTAVATADEWQPDAVVLDVMLPGFDGHEVCRRVQAQRPVPVLMLTARDDETDVLVGLGVGADDYLTKPFSMRLLACLAERPGTVLTREELMRDVWGWSDPATARSGTRTVDSHVRSLRAKIGAGRVRTVHGVGYALEEVGVS